uniref:Alpha-tectorin-like isoform X2 n=1 Tax=Saccoglossus kowalevskii TaxID=10224 RepID=A0ABM0MS15_SACKO|nr:PREDICTED: alpha-tectorin-like isoform X2 [Saccoglossus kowalevskii]
MMHAGTLITIFCIVGLGYAADPDFTFTWMDCAANFLEVTIGPTSTGSVKFHIVDVTSGQKVATEIQDYGTTVVYTVPETLDNSVENKVTGRGFRVPLPKCGNGQYEPHMTTFDGYKFNSNGYCSYTLVKSCDDTVYPDFEVTADFRGKNYPYEPPTFMVAFNVTSNGKQLIRINEDDSVLISGKPMTDSLTVIDDYIGKVRKENGVITVYLNELGFTLNWKRRGHGMSITLNDEYLHGRVCGLLGNADDNPKNDFVTPDGQRTFDSVVFSDSWQVPGR